MLTKPTSAANEFLTGGGEMGELIRAYDWESSSLGNPAFWPQSLKTCVRIILTSSQPMFVWWGKELINIYNDAYKSIVRGKHPEALGQPASTVWKEIWNEVNPRVKTVMNDNIGTYDEALLLIMERNGYPEETYYTFSYSPIAGESGGVEGIICANTDSTERIISERQLRTLRDLGKNIQGSLTVGEVYTRMIEVISQNPQDFPFAFIYELDDAGTTAMLAGKTVNITNNNIAPPVIDLNSKAPWSLFRVVKNSAMLVTDELWQYGKLPSGPWEMPPKKALIIPIAKAGQAVPYGVLVVGLNPYRLTDEKYKSFFQLFADQVASGIATIQALIEERKRAEALAEIDRAKTTFFSNISHEFRTPLTLMLGPLEDLLGHNGSDLSNQHRRTIATTHRNAIRLLRLVNGLLDFSRIESGRIHAHYHRTDIAAFTNDLASNFRSVMEKAGLGFDIHCEKINVPVYIDKEMWEKIVFNLLSNAFKYTLRGKIEVSLFEKNDNVVLTVTDTGVGIPEKELPMMFERFHRVQNSAGRSHEGTGIGLSLVSELVKFHDGTISVASKEWQGSTFTVTIPCGKKHLPVALVSEKESDLQSTFTHAYIQEALNLAEEITPDGKGTSFFNINAEVPKTRVMIVDDNADMRGYLTRLLSKQYIIETAANGKQAIEKMSTYQPALIVSDIMMPVMDGVTMLRALKDDEATRNIPIILLSARAGEEEKIEGYTLGADDYLVKPFSAKELLARIQAQLKLVEIRRQQNEVLRQSEQRLRDMIMQAPVSIAILRGPDYIFEIANQDYSIIAGKRYEDIIGKPLLDALPEVRTQGIKELLDHVVETGESFIGNEFPIMINHFGKDELTYFNFIYQPLREPDGTISGVMVVATDVTPQVIAKKNILEAEENSRLAIEAADLGSYTIDLQTGSITATNRFLRMFGFNKDHRITHQDLINSLHPDFIEIRKKAYEVAIKTGFLHYEAKFTGLDHKMRWLKLSGRIFFDENREPLRVLGIAMDITEQREVQQRKDDFIRMASHELKTPVTSIKGYVQLLLSMLQKKEGQQTQPAILESSLQTVDRQVQKLTRLMSELLDISRLESGKLELNNELFELNDLVNDVVQDILYANTRHQISVRHDFRCMIYGDRDRLAQVFINIINNAIKYSPGSGQVVEINIYQEKDDHVAISIKDNGIGIAPDDLERIFERFYRAEGKNEQTYPGFGIGLSIAKEIVSRHQGSISVKSEKDKGSEFIILLPCKTK